MLPIASPPTLPINTSTSRKANTPKHSQAPSVNHAAKCLRRLCTLGHGLSPRGRNMWHDGGIGAGSGRDCQDLAGAEGQETPPLCPARPSRAEFRPRTAGRGSRVGWRVLAPQRGLVVRWPEMAGQANEQVLGHFGGQNVYKSAHEG